MLDLESSNSPPTSGTNQEESVSATVIHPLPSLMSLNVPPPPLRRPDVPTVISGSGSPSQQLHILVISQPPASTSSSASQRSALQAVHLCPGLGRFPCTRNVLLTFWWSDRNVRHLRAYRVLINRSSTVMSAIRFEAEFVERSLSVFSGMPFFFFFFFLPLLLFLFIQLVSSLRQTSNEFSDTFLLLPRVTIHLRREKKKKSW